MFSKILSHRKKNQHKNILKFLFTWTYIHIYITKGLKIVFVLLLESHSSLQRRFGLRQAWKEAKKKKQKCIDFSFSFAEHRRKVKRRLLTMHNVRTRLQFCIYHHSVLVLGTRALRRYDRIKQATKKNTWPQKQTEEYTCKIEKVIESSKFCKTTDNVQNSYLKCFLRSQYSRTPNLNRQIQSLFRQINIVHVISLTLVLGYLSFLFFPPICKSQKFGDLNTVNS